MNGRGSTSGRREGGLLKARGRTWERTLERLGDGYRRALQGRTGERPAGSGLGVSPRAA